MTEQQVAQILRCLDGRWVSPRRVAWLAKISSIYEAEGVLSARKAPALYRACPSAAECWAGAEDRASESAEATRWSGWSGDTDGSIFWPWVGESYKAGGVCLVGMNINYDGDWWSINEEYAIADWETLDQGRRRMPSGSMFAYRAGATAMAVLASLEGVRPVEFPDPREVGVAWERVVRLQAVKCSPLGDRSNPTDTMCDRCPRRYLVRELAVLRPRVLVALGKDARRGIESAGAVSWTRDANGYGRGTLTVRRRRSIEVLVVPHPSAHGRSWQEGQAALVRDLRRNPMR